MMIRLFWFVCCVHLGFGAQILAFFPFPYSSHQHQCRAIAKELSRRGHQVTMYTPFPITAQPNLEIVEMSVLGDEEIFQTDWTENTELSVFQLISILHKGGVKFAKFIWAHPLVRDLLESNRTFDLVLTEGFVSQSTFFALAHRFNASSVSVSTLNDLTWSREFAGTPDNPSYMTDFMSAFSDQMSLSERFITTYHLSVTLALGYWYTLTKLQKVLDDLVVYPGSETRPPLTELMSDQALILSNSHHSFGYPYPTAPHFKHIGGMTIEPNKPLPRGLEEFMNDSEHGVIYFSFGTLSSWSSPSLQAARDTFIGTFAKIKQRVLWKWSEPNPPRVSPNVLISKWFPQQDILAHENVKLFITQCGIVSITEAISSGVPLIGIPNFADQINNAAYMEAKGYGVHISKSNITDSSLEWALNEVLHNPKYKNEIQRRSKLFQDRPMKPMDEAVYWIEYVLRHGKVLQPASVHMRFYQVYCLDIIAAILLAVTVMYGLFRWAIRRLMHRFISGHPPILGNNIKKYQ